MALWTAILNWDWESFLYTANIIYHSSDRCWLVSKTVGRYQSLTLTWQYRTHIALTSFVQHTHVPRDKGASFLLNVVWSVARQKYLFFTNLLLLELRKNFRMEMEDIKLERIHTSQTVRVSEAGEKLVLCRRQSRACWISQNALKFGALRFANSKNNL